MYFHNYLSDLSGQKISTYSQLEEGVNGANLGGSGDLLPSANWLCLKKQIQMSWPSDSEIEN